MLPFFIVTFEFPLAKIPLIKIFYKQFLEHIWEKELKHKYNVVFNKKELSIIRKIFKANEDK